MYDLDQIRKALETAGCTSDQADTVQRCLESHGPDTKQQLIAHIQERGGTWDRTRFRRLIKTLLIPKDQFGHDPGDLTVLAELHPGILARRNGRAQVYDVINSS